MNLKNVIMLAIVAILFSACAEEEEPFIVPVVEGAVIDAEVGGPSQPNQVYVDLSVEETTVVPRNSYDLGFFSGEDFRVVLNNSTSALAYALDKNDLNEVTAEDTLGLGRKLDVDAIFGALFGPPAPWINDAANWMDHPSGDLERTAIAEVSANASANQVYIINRGNNPDGSKRGWKKLRVLRNGNGYTLAYADINAPNYQTLEIPKRADMRFVQVNFDEGIVEATPASKRWDLAFTTFTTLLPVDATTRIPYSFKDYVITNSSEVRVANVNTGDIAYEDFNAGHIAGLAFTSDVAAIGSSWRTVAAPNSGNSTGVVEDIFYVIEDTDQNRYKLRFTRMLNPQTGERGYPQLQYNLITD